MSRQKQDLERLLVINSVLISKLKEDDRARVIIQCRIDEIKRKLEAK